MVDARAYHERTNHVLEELRQTDTSLDFDNEPGVSKRYEDLERVDPAPAGEVPDRPALAAVARSAPDDGRDAQDGGTGATVDVPTLAWYAAGITKTVERQGEAVAFRAASCTGKRYHVDLYVVCGTVPGFDPGVYHYDPESDAFDVLRRGDYRGVLAEASGDDGVADAPATVVATSQWWRNAWKYRERTYRHAFWDSGTVLANLLAVAHASGLRAEVVTGYADAPVVDLLGLDPAVEAPLELVPIGEGAAAPAAPSMDAIDPTEAPLSDTPIQYDLIEDAWRESTLPDAAAAADWRAGFEDLDPATIGRHGIGDGGLVDLDPVDAARASSRPIGNTIERRGSLREWPHDPISDRMLATVLDRALRPVPFDVFRGTGAGDGGLDRLVDWYVLVLGVDGVETGAYQYHPRETALERVGDTDRATAAEIALLQDVVGDAAVNVYAMADVDALVDRLGDRAYRVAQFEAGVGLGRLYLATYAHRRLGGRGFTFLDGRVTDHLSPRAANQSPMTMFAFGNRPTS